MKWLVLLAAEIGLCAAFAHAAFGDLLVWVSPW